MRFWVCRNWRRGQAPRCNSKAIKCIHICCVAWPRSHGFVPVRLASAGVTHVISVRSAHVWTLTLPRNVCASPLAEIMPALQWNFPRNRSGWPLQ
jgi:hypothetical protein